MQKTFRLLIITALFFLVIKKANAQYSQMYYDEKHFQAVSENHAMRLSTESFLQEQTKSIKSNLNDINENLVKLVAVKKLIYDSLYQVNEALKDGKQFLQIIEILNEISEEGKNLIEVTKDFPEGIVFAKEYSLMAYQDSLNLFLFIQDKILKSKKDVLLDYRVRSEIIQEVIWKLKLIRSSIQLASNQIYWAKMMGFWRTINPFKDMIQADKMIIQEIINKSKSI